MYSEFMVYIRQVNLTEMEDKMLLNNTIKGVLSIYSKVDKARLFAKRMML